MKIKVCGMREKENIRAIERLDIDWLGFIFYPGSPRYVADESESMEQIRQCLKTKVGVFVNMESWEILEKVAALRLDFIQLHGDESPEMCRQLQNRGCAVIKAFSVASEVDLNQTSAYESYVDYFLFDTKGSGYGGSGKRFDWSLLDAYQGSTPFLLSGGIGADHISDLLEFHHPRMMGIDLNSRFETAPGLKDIVRLEQFISRLRG